MWEWHALGHIPLSRIEQPGAEVQLPVGLRAHQLDLPGPNGDVLLSSRNTWALYDVDIAQRRDPLAPGRLALELQARRRHARVLAARRRVAAGRADLGVRQRLDAAEGEAVARPPAEARRGRHTVALVQAFTNPSRTLLAASQGNTLSLPGGNWLMGYGGLPNFTEYDSSGHVLLDGTLGKNVQDFRTYLAPWSGHPREPPSVVARPAGAGAGASRRAGTARPTSPPGACWPAPPRAPWRRSRRPQGGLRDDDQGEHGRPVLRGAGARRLGQRARHVGDGQSLSPRRGAPRAVLAGLALLALHRRAAIALLARRSGRAGADRDRLGERVHEPAVSPSCVPPRLNVSAALAGARVTVSPAPDSRDASVSTQISMLGPPAASSRT